MGRFRPNDLGHQLNIEGLDLGERFVEQYRVPAEPQDQSELQMSSFAGRQIPNTAVCELPKPGVVPDDQFPRSAKEMRRRAAHETVPRKEGLLREVGHVSPSLAGWYEPPIHLDDARRPVDKSEQSPDESGLATAVAPDKAHDVAVPQIQVDVSKAEPSPKTATETVRHQVTHGCHPVWSTKPRK